MHKKTLSMQPMTKLHISILFDVNHKKYVYIIEMNQKKTKTKVSYCRQRQTSLPIEGNMCIEIKKHIYDYGSGSPVYLMITMILQYIVGFKYNYYKSSISHFNNYGLELFEKNIGKIRNCKTFIA